MSILIFNRLPYYDVPYDKWLEDLNEPLVILTEQKLAPAFQAKARALSFENYDYNNAVEFVALQMAKKNPFRRIVATAERDILRAARLREHLGIEGQSLESAIAFRDKVKMKTLLKAANVKVPPFAEITSVIDLVRFIEAEGYPVVVKPVDGMGSRNTTILHDDEDTIAYLAEGLTPHLEVEKFIEGEMYHIDGVVLDGVIELCWPSKYLNNCLAFQEGKYLGSYLLEPENPLTPRLQRYVTNVLHILPTPQYTTFHAEVFHTPEDELILCEIACRTGGSRICEEYRQAFDLDLTKLAVQAQCGLTVTVPEQVRSGRGPKTQIGFIGIPPKQGVFLSAPKADELPDWVTEYRLLAEPGQYFDGPHTSVDYTVTLVVTGETEGEVLARLEEVADLFERNTVWQSK
ncbi:ATP-grasp domain-containing protein [Laceyella tengchongensis]|uniref:ATP-grasp domain-containing protein n=1 Tax=Laceyella tengchongensis TaxID=574699 RepID=UPI0012BA1AC2|nr:ATP-grasp domain-containing protein [Laceyella tengchongensis]